MLIYWLSLMKGLAAAGDKYLPPRSLDARPDAAALATAPGEQG